MTRVAAIPRQNAVALDNGEVRLRLGKVVLELTCPPEFVADKPPLALLEFSIRPEPPFAGQRAALTAWWQDVPAGTFQLNAYGPTRIRLALRRFVAPSRLTLSVAFHRDDAFHRGDFDAFTTECATVGGFDLDHAADGTDSRFALVAAARTMAVDLGLQGDYFTPDRAEALAAAVVSALEERRAFSLIRVGDSEGRVLGYPLHFTDHEMLNQVLHYQFGPESMAMVKAAHPDDWVAAAMRPLQAMVSDSLRNADALGLPVEDNVSEAALAREPYGALGFAAGLVAASALGVRVPAAMRFGVNVFQLAAAHRTFFREIAQAARAVHLVTPWDVTAPFAAAVGLDAVHHIRVPGHYTWRGSKGLGQIPDLYRFVEARIAGAGDLSGCLLLVGAGILGKHYCNLAKMRGAVALDIGSVFDAWAGRGHPQAVSNVNLRLGAKADQVA
jgi:hypothetical protein